MTTRAEREPSIEPQVHVTRDVLPSRLVIRNAAVVGTWGEPDAEPVPGFIESSFNPTVFELCRRLLTAGGRGPGPTGIVLASHHGDSVTADVASQRLLAGQRRNALLFYQSVPSSILGCVSAMFGITGPMLTLSGGDDVFEECLRLVGLSMSSAGLGSVLLLCVAVPTTARVRALHRERGYEVPADARAMGFGLELCAVEPGASHLPVLVRGAGGVEVELPGSEGVRRPLGGLLPPSALERLPPDVRGCASACATDPSLRAASTTLGHLQS